MVFNPNASQNTVVNTSYLGAVSIPTGYTFGSTVVGGLSGIAYDPIKNIYYSISDDRSQNAPARFYQLNINLSDGYLNSGDITFTNVTTLLNSNGTSFLAGSIDPEGIALTSNGTVFVASEGDASALVNPFVNEFSLTGQQLKQLPIPNKFLPSPSGTSGVRNNLSFESLTITPNGRFLYTATENALIQDGPQTDLNTTSRSRIIQYDLLTGQAVGEFVYETDPLAAAPLLPNGTKTSGLVELLAIDNNGTLLALERSASLGRSNTIKLYEVSTQQATNVMNIDGLNGLNFGSVAQKRLLLNFASLGIPLDNIEGMTLGPQLPDGRQSLMLVSDNNFSIFQSTQFIALGLDIVSSI